MNIKVIIDFEIIGNYKKDKKEFYENMEILKKISQIYQISSKSLLASGVMLPPQLGHLSVSSGIELPQ